MYLFLTLSVVKYPAISVKRAPLFWICSQLEMMIFDIAIVLTSYLKSHPPYSRKKYMPSSWKKLHMTLSALLHRKVFRKNMKIYKIFGFNYIFHIVTLNRCVSIYIFPYRFHKVLCFFTKLVSLCQVENLFFLSKFWKKIEISNFKIAIVWEVLDRF